MSTIFNFLLFSIDVSALTETEEKIFIKTLSISLFVKLFFENEKKIQGHVFSQAKELRKKENEIMKTYRKV